MIEHQEIIAICTQFLGLGEFDRNSRVGVVNSYYVLYALKSNGPIDLEALLNIYREMNPLKNNSEPKPSLIGPFMDLSELKIFLSKVCEEFDAPKIILSTEADYNNAVSLSSTSSELILNLINSGSEINNIDYKESKGFLEKLFS